jgi:hypothetical protein
MRRITVLAASAAGVCAFSQLVPTLATRMGTDRRRGRVGDAGRRAAVESLLSVAR